MVKSKTAAGGVDGQFAVLPLRDIVVFPYMIVPLFVGREKSIRALEDVMAGDKMILLATQKNATDDDPGQDAIYRVGTLASVLQLLKLPDGTVKVLVEGRSRAEIRNFTSRAEFYEADVSLLAESDDDEVELEALSRSVVTDFENYVKLNKKISPDVVNATSQIDDFSKLGRHGRRAFVDQDRREAGYARNSKRQGASGKSAWAYGVRSFCPAG